jgi:hypothetical protein
MSTIAERSADLAPFGWYPDPAGSDRMRWWDGQRWTEKLEPRRPDMQPAYGYSDGHVTELVEY